MQNMMSYSAPLDVRSALLHRSRWIIYLGLILYTLVEANTVAIFPYIALPSAIILFAAVRNRNPDFDAMDMFWLLSLLFFVLSPAMKVESLNVDGSLDHRFGVEYLLGATYVYPISILVTTFAIITVALLMGALFLPASNIAPAHKPLRIAISPQTLALLAVFAALAVIATSGGLGNILAARHDRDGGGSPIALVFRGLYLSASILFFAQPGRKALWLPVILAIHILLFNPFNTARFFLVQAWMPVAMIMVPKLRRFEVFAGILAFGIIVVMPILSYTTRNGLNAYLAKEAVNSGAASNWLSFMDSAQVLIHLVYLVGRHGHEWGLSTLGVVLFFVPRVIWPSKPEPYGSYVGDDLFNIKFAGTTNLSGTISGDFYYDFGLLGVVVGSILLSLFYRRLLRTTRYINGHHVLGYMLTSQLPILIRGSVEAVAGLAVFSVAFYFAIIFCSNRIAWSRK